MPRKRFRESYSEALPAFTAQNLSQVEALISAIVALVTNVCLDEKTAAQAACQTGTDAVTTPSAFAALVRALARAEALEALFDLFAKTGFSCRATNHKVMLLAGALNRTEQLIEEAMLPDRSACFITKAIESEKTSAVYDMTATGEHAQIISLFEQIISLAVKGAFNA